MSNQYVVYSASRKIRLFEGTRPEVYAWVKKSAALDAPGYAIVDRHTLVTYEEGDFIRKFEEDLAKLEAPKPLTEDRIRTIVREEMSKLIDAVREKSFVPEHYDTEKMEDALIAIVDHRAERRAKDDVNSHESNYHDGGYDYS